MKLELDDLFENKDGKKEKLITLPVTCDTHIWIEDVKRQLGRRTVAEIMRRSIRVGLNEALSKFKPKAS